MIEFKIVKDNTKEVLADIDQRTDNILKEIGELVVKSAKEIVPVDTGNLRDSIDYEVSDGTVTVGSPVEYAVYVELGTSRMDAQPYIRPAVEDNTNAIRQIAEKGYKQ